MTKHAPEVPPPRGCASHRFPSAVRPFFSRLSLALCLALAGVAVGQAVASEPAAAAGPALASEGPGTDAAPSPWRFDTKGYGMALWSFLDEPLTGERESLGTHRLRLESDLRRGRRWNLKTVLDLEGYGGSLVRSSAFDRAAEPQDPSYWDLDSASRRSSDVVLRAALHRLYLTFETPEVRADVGKQRIAWGVMRFWRPTDLFDPESPLQIESGERLGIDALRVNAPLSSGGGDLEGVTAPSHADGAGRSALKYHRTVGVTDLSLVGGNLGGTSVTGLSFDSYVRDAGLRGELVRVEPPSGRTYSMVALGGDYAFPDNLTLTLEYFHNGGAAGLGSSPLTAYRGLLTTRRSNLVGLGVDKLISPLVRGNLFVSWDVDGGGWALQPRVGWDYRQDHELSVGLALFGGPVTGEYGLAPRTVFMQWKRYF